MNYERPVNFEVDASRLYDSLCKLQESTSSLLTTDKKAAILEGYAESGIICCHLKLKNPTKEVVTFCVKKPPIGALSISPKLGIVKPEKEIWVYIRFGGRLQKIPDDGVLLLSLFQASFEFPDVDKIESMEAATRIARKVFWCSRRDKQVENVLHLPLVWKAKKDNPLHEEHVDVFKREAANKTK